MCVGGGGAVFFFSKSSCLQRLSADEFAYFLQVDRLPLYHINSRNWKITVVAASVLTC